MNSALRISVCLAGFAVAAARPCCGSGLPLVEPESLGMSAEKLEQIVPILERGVAQGRCAGCVVAVGRRGGLVFRRCIGDRQVEPARHPMTEDTVFDLASVTKPVATATSILLLVERGLLHLSDPVHEHLPPFAEGGKESITVADLLTHHGGLVPDNPIEDFIAGEAEASLQRTLRRPTEAPPRSKFMYSDVGFMTLGALVEQVAGRPLDRFASEELFQPLGMHDTGFLPSEALRNRAAATEKRDGRWLVGEVHDPRSTLLGGVAGHAGLFSTADDLARFATMLLGEGYLADGPSGPVRVLHPLTVRTMTAAREVSGQRRTYGWDSRSVYSRNRGDLFSDRAFGHGGFTGTALWIDPELDLYVVFLSTRLHPDGIGLVNDLAGCVGSVAASAVQFPNPAPPRLRDVHQSSR